MPEHPKVEGLSDAAFRLLVTSWCWSSRQLTDGRIPATSWAKRGTAKARRELVAAGLAEVGDDGTVQLHDYLEHQRSAAEVAALREKRREAGRRGGTAKARAVASAKQTSQQTDSTDVPETETDTEPATDVAGERADKPRPQRRHRLPDGFEITDGMRAWAADNVPGVDVDRETEKFADHHAAKGSVMADWTRAWHTWMRRAEEYAPRATPGPGGIAMSRNQQILAAELQAAQAEGAPR
jgi:hypothetical protein